MALAPWLVPSLASAQIQLMVNPLVVLLSQRTLLYNWQAAVASITGLVAKENIVGTMGILYGGEETWANLAAAFTHPAGMSFLIFNLLCAPCFAAIGAIKREMNSRKWTWAAIGWQCGFAYVVSFCVYQFGGMFSGAGNIAGFICAIAVLAVFVWALFRKPSKI